MTTSPSVPPPYDTVLASGMTKKAREFKTRTQREAKPPRAKRPVRPRRDDPVDTAKPGTSATDRKATVRAGSANRSKRAGKKGGAALEKSPSRKPSRKSTRKSSGRVKSATSLARKAVRASKAPKTQAGKATGRDKDTSKAKPRKVRSRKKRSVT